MSNKSIGGQLQPKLSMRAAGKLPGINGQNFWQGVHAFTEASQEHNSLFSKNPFIWRLPGHTPPADPKGNPVGDTSNKFIAMLPNHQSNSQVPNTEKTAALPGWGTLQRTGVNLYKYFNPKLGKAWSDRLKTKLNDPSLHNLIDETGKGGRFDSLAHPVAGLIRGLGGGLLGNALEENTTGDSSGLGLLSGAAAGFGSPAALRAVGRSLLKRKPDSQLGRVFADKNLSRRLLNDPMSRGLAGNYAGSIADAGASALGYDTNGWGATLGTGMGIGGGLRPWLQLTRGINPSFKSLTDKLVTGKWTKNTVKHLEDASTGGYNNLTAWALSSPVTKNMGVKGIAATALGHGLFTGLVGMPLEEARQARDAYNQLIDSPNAKALQKQLDTLLKQVYGPDAEVLTPSGMPTAQAIGVLGQLGNYAAEKLKNTGSLYFNDENYLLNPLNWNTLDSPWSTGKAITKAQFRRLNQ
jgi:hypothetical protein